MNNYYCEEEEEEEEDDDYTCAKKWLFDTVTWCHIAKYFLRSLFFVGHQHLNKYFSLSIFFCVISPKWHLGGVRALLLSSTPCPPFLFLTFYSWHLSKLNLHVNVLCLIVVNNWPRWIRRTLPSHRMVGLDVVGHLNCLVSLTYSHVMKKLSQYQSVISRESVILSQYWSVIFLNLCLNPVFFSKHAQ